MSCSLRPSLLANGIDPATLKRGEKAGFNADSSSNDVKAWKEIWSAGQGIGAITSSSPAREYVDWLVEDYDRARNTLMTDD